MLAKAQLANHTKPLMDMREMDR